VKVSELLHQRRQNWQELELLCEQVKSSRRKLGPAQITRFAALYRAACADLALADAYQLPPNTVDYLHRLVGRAHNQLYRGRHFNLSSWAHLLLYVAPQRIFADRCIQIAFCAFWGVFILSAAMAYSKSLWPSYAEQILGQEMIDMLESNFKEPLKGRDIQANYAMAGFYIQHNTGIGLKCFASGLAVVPGIFICIFNASVLGASFGYMARPDVPEGVNFFHFVTAHGPFELTAIVLSAGSGLRLGLSWIFTDGSVLSGRIDRRLFVAVSGSLLDQGGYRHCFQRRLDILLRRAWLPAPAARTPVEKPRATRSDPDCNSRRHPRFVAPYDSPLCLAIAADVQSRGSSNHAAQPPAGRLDSEPLTARRILLHGRRRRHCAISLGYDAVGRDRSAPGVRVCDEISG
jgi:uncharacterized membrane protein SpoIIM required for sporulation